MRIVLMRTVLLRRTIPAPQARSLGLNAERAAIRRINAAPGFSAIRCAA
ncbi:hypothetical protein [Variovorax defluvii]